MIEPPRLHLAPPDVRRAGLLVVGAADHPRLRDLCQGFVEEGYEVMAVGARDMTAGVLALAGPVVVLALGEGAAHAWAGACGLSAVAGLSLFDPPLEALAGAPVCPVIIHFSLEGGAVSIAELDALRERWPELPVYPYRTAPGFLFGDSDPARLARLRTLQLFHRAGGKAEMGG
jgi:carboxymethylenebutenolidase